jgi:methionine synthase I (cobalamin-dependent)
MEELSAAGPALTAGTKFIGGCCGTNPQFIEALRARLTACP